MNEHDLMQQVLDKLLGKTDVLYEHGLTGAVYLLCDWSAKYHLSQLKARAVQATEPAALAPTYLAMVSALDLTLNRLLAAHCHAVSAGAK